jgi:hypothetical protein
MTGTAPDPARSTAPEGEPVTEPTGVRWQVPADYRHYPKQVVPLPDADLVTGATRLKWYEIREPQATVPAGWRERSREFLLAQAESGALPLNGDGGEAGFVIHHLCGASYYFLLVWTWRNSNELWETVYGAELGQPFAPLPDKDHREVACVWELGVVLAERQSWTNYLRSDRDALAEQVYLADRYAGPC